MLQPISIGRHKIERPVFLAPMSGVSDLPFRRLAWRFGAGLVVSEMVASESLASGNAEMRTRMAGEGVGIHVVQLAGREAHWMDIGARIAADTGADIIDINMGCPARKVTNGYSGSALMRDPDHALSLIEATVNAVDVPVTLKMRLGWDDNHLNAPEIAKRAENAGVQLITVHGRTRCQFYKGSANWKAISEVVDAVQVPVIANGDLVHLDQVPKMLSQSGARGLMIGRGAYGRPWFPGHVAQRLASESSTTSVPKLADVGELAMEHYDAILEHYGSRVGVRAARKHIGWYLDRIGFADGMMRKAIMTSPDPREVVRLISLAFDRSGSEGNVAA